MAHPLMAEVLKLNAVERLQLVGDICASIEVLHQPLT
jgi:hypothetical protein